MENNMLDIYYIHGLERTGRHTSDCCFYVTDVSGHTSTIKRSIEYSNLPSTLRPMSQSEELFVPKLSESYYLEDDAQMEFGD
jgi:hypothetical protein